jgi:hypothetical protein
VLSFVERLRASHVAATVAAALLLIVGILVIVYPSLLAWIVGIGLVLTSIGMLVSVYVPRDSDDF